MEYNFYQTEGALSAMAADNTLTLFWDKPASAPADGYTVAVNGGNVGKTDKTHYTLTGLSPETAFAVSVSAVGEARFSTTAEKRKIDVSLPPYSAVGDGKTMNTAALQKALDACNPDEAVYLPAGVYKTGALRLHSNMELYLAKDAVLQGTDVVEDYLPRIKSRFEGTEMECYSSLLNLGELDRTAGYTCENVVIRGEGTIASGGQTLALKVIASETERLKAYLTALGDKIKECENDHTIPGRVRPRLINISNAHNIWISGLTLKNGASWNVHMIYSDRIVTDHCTFRSEGVWNGDGWDPDSSTNCTLFASKFFTGDDAVAIKSGKNPEGNIVNRPCEHIRVFDCVSAFGHGICIGSEMSGGVSDVKIWDCDMGNSMSGIEIKGTSKRGAYVRDLQVRDCVTSHIMMHAVPYNNDGISAGMPPVFSDCYFSGVTILGKSLDHEGNYNPCDAIELCGFDEPGYEVKNIRFEDITLVGGTQTISLCLCENITIERVRCVADKA